MNQDKKTSVEALLEHLGDGLDQIPECSTHRYALRRSLLNSAYFDDEQQATRRHKRLIAPVLVSGFAAVFLLTALQVPGEVMSEGAEGGSVTVPVPVSVSTSATFLGTSEELSAVYVDDRPMVPVTYQPNLISLSLADVSVHMQ